MCALCPRPGCVLLGITWSVCLSSKSPDIVSCVCVFVWVASTLKNVRDLASFQVGERRVLDPCLRVTRIYWYNLWYARLLATPRSLRNLPE